MIVAVASSVSSGCTTYICGSYFSPHPVALGVLGQYWANISGQLRRHVALPGRSLEFGRRCFRSF